MIDTNVFLLVAGYSCLLDQDVPPAQRAARLRTIRACGDNLPPERFDALWRVFHAAQRRLVTQHVTAEAYNLGHIRWDWLLKGLSGVWHASLGQWHVEELPCALSDLYADEVYRRIVDQAGPTDAGLILTAKRERATILSEDRRLAGYARQRAVEALSPWEIDRLWQE